MFFSQPFFKNIDVLCFVQWNANIIDLRFIQIEN